MSDRNSFSDIITSLAIWQGSVSYTLCGLYAVNPEIFFYYLGDDPGPILFGSMIYGNTVFMFTRPAMKKLVVGYRFIFSLCGSYAFCTSSIIIFLSLGEVFWERKLLGCTINYCTAKLLYHMFYTYLYFVDRIVNPQMERDSTVEFIFKNDTL